MTSDDGDDGHDNSDGKNYINILVDIKHEK
jgi:hypothetical protein